MKIKNRYVPTEPQFFSDRATTDLGLAFSILHGVIEELVPVGRDRAIAITHLEDAYLRAKYAIEIEIALPNPGPYEIEG